MIEGFDEKYAAEQIRRRHSLPRRAIKYFYLHNVLRRLNGPTIDLGCGAGQLLERLPSGSVGLEANRTLVEFLADRGLDIRWYDAIADGFALTPLRGGQYRHLVCAHVIEHFERPDAALRGLASSCLRLGVETLTFIVPGAKGFASDRTHQTFVTEDYLRHNRLTELADYRLSMVNYFPFDIRNLGSWLTYHECHLTWQRK
jgi:2-polyprenyl-3-methyl-5-hydroxy-6-metoxy-1,4-benzoquinol methylase